MTREQLEKANLIKKELDEMKQTLAQLMMEMNVQYANMNVVQKIDYVKATIFVLGSGAVYQKVLEMVVQIRLIRIRIKNEVYVTKHVYGYSWYNSIAFFYKDDLYTVKLKDSNRIDVLLSQACEKGYIDFSKEEVVSVYPM